MNIIKPEKPDKADHPKVSNYELMRDLMEKEFLKYDQQKMIEKFHLKNNEQYLYLNFVGRECRIGRSDGKVEYQDVEYQESETKVWVHADYNISMTIFDVLCCSKADCHLSGTYASINNVKKGIPMASAGAGMFQKESSFFAGCSEKLKSACERLGGIPQQSADVSYMIMLFDFLPVILQFWDADEEFDAVLKIMWDTNILDYMHFETTFFAVGHLLSRLME
ncbi:MAG: DUF3786 domain-containing protein [Lachnospiraceae bacterium]|nr:DUF3786 domain-containing protein [Lachnospiraceae bacterium]MDY4968690.1 DUF3786 domain-containing protein [Lachnospiraceae bacterium]